MAESIGDPADSDPGEIVLPGELGHIEQRESSIEDVAGSPTWPELPTGPEGEAIAPPVGLNWFSVARAFGWDQEVLRHDGSIVARGEYFPEEGYFIDPATMQPRHVDVGDRALRSGYFLGKSTTSQFGVLLVPIEEEAAAGMPIIAGAEGTIVALFGGETALRRAKDKVLRNGLGSGITSQQGPLGWELRVERPELPGRVATVLAHFGGAIITLGGRPVASDSPVGPATTTSPAALGGDRLRPGTGATGATQGPPAQGQQTEVVDGKQVNSV